LPIPTGLPVLSKRNGESNAGPVDHVEQRVGAEATEFPVHQVANPRLVDAQPRGCLNLFHPFVANEARELGHELLPYAQACLSAGADRGSIPACIDWAHRQSEAMIGH
jgi:hypothetical protein